MMLALACLAAGAGCKATYKQTFNNPRSEIAPLRANTHIYIAMPEDAMDKKNPVAQSGRRTAVALETAFKRQTRYVVTSRVPEILTDAISHARDAECEYVAFPTILKWQDRPTEWSGVRDKLGLKIELVSVATGETVRSTDIEAKSKFMTDGEDEPQDLLAEPVDRFVRSLFRAIYTPSALQK